MVAHRDVGDELDRDQLLRRLVQMQYERNDVDFHRGCFRVRGDVVEVFPAYEDDTRSASSSSATKSKRSERSIHFAASRSSQLSSA